MAARSEVISNANVKVEFAIVANRDTVPTTLLELKGANTASNDSGIQTVPIDSFGDGLYMPEFVVGLGSTYSVSGIATTDTAGDTYKSAAEGADAGTEIYFVLTEGNGAKTAFYALITAYSQQRDQRNVLQFSSTVKVQSAPTLTAAP